MNLFGKSTRIALLIPVLSIVFSAYVEAQGVPTCKKNDERTKVLTWKPSFKANGTLAKEPPTGEGTIVYIKAQIDSSIADCAVEDSDIYSIEHLSGVTRDGGGLSVNFPSAAVQYSQGFCYISGFFMNKDVPGMHGGFSETYFEPIDLQKIVLSGQFCMKK